MNSISFGHQTTPKKKEPFQLEAGPLNPQQQSFKIYQKIQPLQHHVLTLGTIGWAIAVPTLMGAALGLWVDTLWPSGYSWLSVLLPIGVVTGCLTALFWDRPDTL